MIKNKRFRSVLCLILSVAMLLTLSGGVIAEPVEGELGEEVVEEEEGVIGEIDLSGYEAVTQSGDLTMYVNKETTHFYLENAATGKLWHSVPADIEYDDISKGATVRGTVRSELLISYVNREEMATVEYAQEANSNADAEMTLTMLPNGIRVVYYFYAVGLTIPVEYTLKDGHFFAEVKVDEITEEEEAGFVLIDITVLPAFGAGNWIDEGYLFVPDGCGALVKFNNGIQLSSLYKSMVYGADLSVVAEEQFTYKENIRLPVFGTMVGDKDALMGIITVGDAASSITVLNGHDRCGYNAVSSVFHYRVMQAQRNLFNKRDINLVAEPEYGLGVYQVRYDVLDADKADYIGMAEEYRNYLVEEKGLTKKDAKPMFHLNAIGSFEQDATFLGIIPYTDRVALTTYEECQTIIEDLKNAGITDISLRYTGFSNNGIDNVKLPKAATALKVLGGASKMDALQTYAASNGIDFYPEADLIVFEKNGNGIKSRKHAIRNVFGKIMLQPKYMLSTYVTVLNSAKDAILSPEMFEKVNDRYLASLQKEEFSAVALSTMGEYCYSNFYEDNEQYRATFPQKVEAVLKKYKDAGVKLSFKGGNAFVLPYADVITDVPMNSSNYDIFEKDVPFYQAVLHGYVPYTTKSLPQTADSEVAYLAAVETGSELNYIGIHEDASELFDTEYNHLYGTTWTLWKDVAAEQYAEYMPLLKEIYNQPIVQHEEIADGVFLTGYANGVQVAVNYNAEDVTVQEQTIPAKSFSKCVWKEVTADEEV